jgi:hypothetical protein
VSFLFGDCRVTLIREREAEVRDPETDELVETFMVPDDFRLDSQATIYLTIDPFQYEDEA